MSQLKKEENSLRQTVAWEERERPGRRCSDATWRVKGLLSNRILSYLQVSLRISSDDGWEADHTQLPEAFNGAAARTLWTRQNFEFFLIVFLLIQNRWGEAAHGIHLEEDQAGNWERNVVVPQQWHQMSTTWGPTLSHFQPYSGQGFILVPGLYF